jgi:hypothetical protein
MEDKHPPNITEDEEEQRHFKQVIAAFFNYSMDAMRDIARMEKDYT